MAKLHEMLAAEGPLKAQAIKIRTDLAALFDKKSHHFTERRRLFRPTDETGVEREEEAQTMQATVYHELRWLQGLWAKALDVSYQVQAGCQIGKGDVVLDDGAVLLKDVPVLALLELEKRATELHQFVAGIPTLDPAKNFELDPARDHIYRAREVHKTRTVKESKVVVLLEPTKEHPGRAELVPYDKPVGVIVEQEWSGLITPKEKAAMLERTDELQRAIKTARTRANEVVITDVTKIGDVILGYAFGA